MIAGAKRGVWRVLVGGAVLLASAQAQEPSGYDPLSDALTRARAELEAGRPAAAVEAARRATDLAPDDLEARLALVRALNAAGRHGRVLELHEALGEPRRTHGLDYEAALAARALGDTERAEGLLLGALGRYPSSGPARAALVELRYSSAKLEGAGRVLADLRRQAPELPWAIAMDARLRAAAGDGPGAIELLRAALDADDAAGSVRFALIESLIADRPDQALEVATPWLDAPPSLSARLLAGRAALAAGDGLTALEVGLTALRREPSSSDALELATVALGEAGAVAVRLLERRLAAAPEDVGTRAALARRAIDAADSDRALALVEGARPPVDPDGLDAETAAPLDPLLELLAIEALRRLERTDAASARVEALLANEGVSAGAHLGRAHYERGWLRFEAGELDPAAEDFARAAADPQLRALARYNQGVALERLGRYAESAGAYERALAADPSLSQAWLQLGNHFQFRLGERAKAADAYRRFLALAGEDAQVRAWLEEVSR